MFRSPRPPIAMALVATLAVAGVAVLAAHDGAVEKHAIQLKLKTADGVDTIELDDLGDLEVGESRSFTTDSGKAVIVTRDEKGYALDLDGKTIRVGGGWDLHTAHGHDVQLRKKIEVGGESADSFVVSDAPGAHRVIVKKMGDGENAFAFSTEGAHPRIFFGGPGLLDRIEKNEKFLSLDDATQQLVREILSESAEPLHWISEDAGDGERIEIHVEREIEDDDEE